MCKYVKDGGEKCGIDNHGGDYCHLHEDTEQAELAEGYSEVAEDDENVFLPLDDPSLCDDCETPVRRAVAAVTEAKFKPKRVVVEEEFTCNCGSVTIGTKEFDKTDVPSGWY